MAAEAVQEAGVAVGAVVAAGVVQEAESNKLKCNLMYRNFKQLIPPPLMGEARWG